MAVTDNVVTSVGDVLYASVSSAYQELTQINGFVDEVTGEDSQNYFSKFFRWSTDNQSFSDWELLTDENLSTIILNPDNDFWIQYMYEVESLTTGHTMELISISLEVITKQGTTLEIPCVSGCIGEDCFSGYNLILTDCCPGDNFNPYDVDIAKHNYTQLSCLVAQMFGIPVTYYRTDPKSDCSDVVLKEYALYDVVQKDEINVNFPDNEFPTQELNFDTLGMHSQDMFEVHIVKSMFNTAFGEGLRPMEGDYLHIPMLDKVYEVNSIALPDDPLLTFTYYRVMLTDYEHRENRDMSTLTGAQDEIESLITNLDTEFGEDRKNEELKIRKPLEYNIIGTGTDDFIRSAMNSDLVINAYKLRNNFTNISKYNYDLSTVTANAVATTYRYNTGIAETDDRAFTFWFKPSFEGVVYDQVSITSIENNNGYVQLNLSTHSYEIGDIINVVGTVDYNGYKRITAVSATSVILNDIYISTQLIAGYTTKHEVCEFINYGNKFGIIMGSTFISMYVNNNYYVFDIGLELLEFMNGQWYGIVMNLSNTFNQISAFAWEIETGTGSNRFNLNSELQNIYQDTIRFTDKAIIEDNLDWNLLGTNIALTNIRIFKKPIEVEEQSLVLNQYVVGDSHLAVLVDNARPEMTNPRKTNPR